MSTYFREETAKVLKDWDGSIYCRTISGVLEKRQLIVDLPCGDSVVPKGFIWDGASSGVLRSIPLFGFPKWKHPIASCRHDWRCSLAKNAEERKIADKLFVQDVAIGGTKWEQIKGYLGVRAGAYLGIGVNY